MIKKHRYSGFFGTDLDIILREWGIDTVIISGTTTENCCHATARDAMFRNYRVVFLSDATATYDYPDRGFGPMPNGDVHHATLVILAASTAHVMSVADLGAAAGNRQPVRSCARRLRARALGIHFRKYSRLTGRHSRRQASARHLGGRASSPAIFLAANVAFAISRNGGRGRPPSQAGQNSAKRECSRQEASGQVRTGNHASGFLAEDGIAVPRDTVVEPVGKPPRQDRTDAQERPGIGHEA